MGSIKRFFEKLRYNSQFKELERLLKIRRYSMAMLFCFILMYLSVMIMQIVESMGDCFDIKY